MIFRISHRLMGTHVHMTVYVAENSERTFASCGSLVMSANEFNAFTGSQMNHFQWIEEHDEPRGEIVKQARESDK